MCLYNTCGMNCCLNPPASLFRFRKKDPLCAFPQGGQTACIFDPPKYSLSGFSDPIRISGKRKHCNTRTHIHSYPDFRTNPSVNDCVTHKLASIKKSISICINYIIITLSSFGTRVAAIDRHLRLISISSLKNQPSGRKPQ